MTVLARVAALVLAVGLVLGGLALRDRGQDGAVDGDGPDGDARASAFACTDDLTALCVALSAAVGSDLEVASATQLADRLQDDEGLVWLAPRGWADLVDDARQRAGLDTLARAGEPLASTGLLLVGWQARMEVLATDCGVAVDALTWDCVGSRAGRAWSAVGGDVRWGRVRPGHAPPDTGLGLTGTAAVLASRAGLGFSLADLRDPAVAGWFSDLERAVVDHTPADRKSVV